MIIDSLVICLAPLICVTAGTTINFDICTCCLGRKLTNWSYFSVQTQTNASGTTQYNSRLLQYVQLAHDHKLQSDAATLAWNLL